MVEEGTRLIQIGSRTFRLEKKPNGTWASIPVGTEEEEGTLLIPKERKVLGKFESESQPGTFHHVYLLSSGALYCTCPGFLRHKKCWHYKMVEEVGPENLTGPIEITYRKEPL